MKRITRATIFYSIKNVYIKSNWKFSMLLFSKLNKLNMAKFVCMPESETLGVGGTLIVNEDKLSVLTDDEIKKIVATQKKRGFNG